MQIEKTFQCWFGIDVSKNTFTAAQKSVGPFKIVYPKKVSFTIDAKGVNEFMEWAKSFTVEFGIAMEATGIYSQRLTKLIRSAYPSQHVAICNAAAISWYVKSYTEEKNDKADAGFIARFACDRNPSALRQISASESLLKETVRERDRLVGIRLEMKNALDSIEDKENIKLHQKVINTLDKTIERLEKKINDIIDSDDKIKKEITLMITVPGVGKISAACFYGELGSMTQYTRKQISALSGVCPVNKFSGISVRRHTISKRGSKIVRKILYLDSFQSILRIPAMKEFYQRMLSKPESSKMSARCACMRKLLLILHAIVVNGKDFDPNYVSCRVIKKTVQPA